MPKQTNAYLQRRAEQNLGDDDREAYGRSGDASAVSNDILRSMLSSKAEEGTENAYPDELPPEVFETIYRHSLLLEAYVDEVRERTNVNGPAVETAMLDLAALEMERNALLITGTFETAEELVEETPAGWEAARRYASQEQKQKIGDLPRKITALGLMTNAAGGFVREAVRVPDGPELWGPGEPTSQAVDDARQVLRKHLQLASTYGPDSSATELKAALRDPNVKGAEQYHVGEMIEAGVAHDTLVSVMGAVGLSFADFPNLAIAHFTAMETADENGDAIVVILRLMDLGENGAGYASKIVDLVPLNDPDKFVAQLELVRSYNLLVEFQEARRVVDPPDGETPRRLATEGDVAALTTKPRQAREAYEEAQGRGLGAWLAALGRGGDLVLTHARNIDDAEIQGAMTHEVVFGAAPGEESDAVLMAQAEEAARRALDAEGAARDQAEALGLKLPGLPATDRLKAWYEYAKSVQSAKEKVEAVFSEGLGGARGYDALQASVGVAKTAAGVVKETAGAAGDAYELEALRRKSHIPRDHLHDLVSPRKGVQVPDPSTPRIERMLQQADRFKAIADAAEGVALVGDVIGLADGFKKILVDRDFGGGALDVAGGAVGIAGTIAGQRVAAQGLAYGATYQFAQAAGPIGFLISYIQLIHGTFAQMKAADNALLARHGIGVFTAVSRETQRGGRAALKAATLKRMLETNSDPARKASFERELARETAVAAAAVRASHRGVLRILSSDPAGDMSDVYNTWVKWPAKKDEFRLEYEASASTGLSDLVGAEATGSFDPFHTGSETVFTGMKGLAETVERFVKEKSK